MKTLIPVLFASFLINVNTASAERLLGTCGESTTKIFKKGKNFRVEFIDRSGKPLTALLNDQDVEVSSNAVGSIIPEDQALAGCVELEAKTTYRDGNTRYPIWTAFVCIRAATGRDIFLIDGSSQLDPLGNMVHFQECSSDLLAALKKSLQKK